GIAESILAERIKKWEDRLPSYIKLAYLPGPQAIKLRLSAYGYEQGLMEKEVDRQIEELKKIIPEYFFGFEGDTLASVLGNLLLEKEATLSVAESCTGGYIAHQITSVAGSSEWFRGSVVAYSNDLKEKLLDVDSSLIEKYGAVSLEVVQAMVRGAIKNLNSDYAIATSGIAGPTGGTPEKPIGTVWIAIGDKKEIIARRYNFGDNRSRNIVRSTQTGLNMLRNFMLK
ncbi:MAG: nicotinamide-nucleotide amidohydrolase family protein, partial [Bacteroidota bacterium]|nr:nicotinamide-nucleotide amidohydrolase family protein [Bacteroidota bacterium]